MDFEQGRAINDIAIQLTQQEASELAGYLARLLNAPDIKTAHLSEVRGTQLTREITIRIE
ncbi:MAG: hypothetical protein ABL962_13995 [Fimbriimonadaceae bacterium]